MGDKVARRALQILRIHRVVGCVPQTWQNGPFPGKVQINQSAKKNSKIFGPRGPGVHVHLEEWSGVNPKDTFMKGLEKKL